MEYTIAFALLAGVLLVAAVLDWRTGLIPNWLVYPAILAGLALWTGAGWFHGGAGGAGRGFGAALAGFAAGFLPFAALFFLLGGVGGETGGGDAKLLGAMGALLGHWGAALDAIVYGYVLAVVMALVIMIARRLLLRTLLRLVQTALMLAARARPATAQDSPRVPMAVAFCAGGLLAGAHALLGLKLPWSGFAGGG